MKPTVSDLAGLALINAAAALLALAFTGVTWTTPWRQWLEAYGVCLLFANCIGILISLVIPRVGPSLARRVASPLYWIALGGVLIVIAAIGSLLALIGLTAIGYLDGTQVFAAWLGSGLHISIIVTLVFGIFGIALATMRARLEATTLALRTKERDESEARRLAAEAQLASLESRVQPHFLFNTLNSIAALVHQDPAGAERMTGQLASLLRSSLDSAAAPLVPLEAELETVRHYLEIERVRFAERLRYDIQVVDEALPAPVPRMCLQTLVENSVKYAVSPRRNGGSIVVRITLQDDRARLEVEDDGPGFDAASIPPNHGLALLRDRLAMIFGERATLRLESGPGRTCATIDLPAAGSSP